VEITTREWHLHDLEAGVFGQFRQFPLKVVSSSPLTGCSLTPMTASGSSRRPRGGVQLSRLTDQHRICAASVAAQPGNAARLAAPLPGEPATRQRCHALRSAPQTEPAEPAENPAKPHRSGRRAASASAPTGRDGRTTKITQRSARDRDLRKLRTGRPPKECPASTYGGSIPASRKHRAARQRSPSIPRSRLRRLQPSPARS
jgi:hypothetical protein